MPEARETELPNRRAGWWSDILSSLVVFMVALPLCLGIAQACGLPPMAGIVTGIVGGLLVGTLAGSPLQVSGPAAGLIVLVIQFMDSAGALGKSPAESVVMLSVAIALAGLLQLLAGAMRLGQWFRAVSPAVVEGMLAGIGITIIAKQFHVMVDDTPPKDIVEGLLTIPNAVWKAVSPPTGADIHHREAAMIGVLSIVVLAVWKLTKRKSLKFIPSAVVAVLAAVIVNEFGCPVLEACGVVLAPAGPNGGLGVERVKVSGNLLDGLVPLWTAWPGFDVFGYGMVWKGALTFALIASAESLLCATAVDTMHRGPRTKYDRELMAQGLGNCVCGALGSLPMTGVIVRSSANVDAGAKTRLSSILHGLWLLVFVAALPALLSRIPVAALAAILVYTGWRLVNIPGLIRLWKESKTEALIYVATAVAIVAGDLLSGVVLGIVLSALKLLVLFSHLKITRRDEPETNAIVIELEGSATFLRLPKLAARLEALPRGCNVHIVLDQVQLIDHAIMHMLMTFQKQYEATGGQLVMDLNQLHAHFQGAPVIHKFPSASVTRELRS